jgi:hypothetical protein
MAILSKQIGWSNESNLLWEILKKLNRLAGIITGLKPKYKVFTALLSQNGSTPNYIPLSNGPLTIGVTYRITLVGEGTDFTVVGARNNDVNTYFIATGENAIWGIDGELEYDVNGTKAVILENTIGNDIFILNENSASRIFFIKSVYDRFPEQKTAIFHHGIVTDEGNYLVSYLSNINQITAICDIPSILYNQAIEIRVYN